MTSKASERKKWLVAPRLLSQLLSALLSCGVQHAADLQPELGPCQTHAARRVCKRGWGLRKGFDLGRLYFDLAVADSWGTLHCPRACAF